MPIAIQKPPAPGAHIAPALISIEDLAVLLEAGRDDRHFSGEALYTDHSGGSPHYLDGFIDLLPPAPLEKTGAMVDRRA